MSNLNASPQKTPPFNREAERAVLGSIFLNNKVIDDVVNILSSEDFYFKGHQQVFEAMLNLYEKQEAIDVLTIHNELEKSGVLSDIGGNVFLAELLEETSSVANVEHYAKIVRDKAILRRLIRAAEQIVLNAYQGEGDVSEIVSEAESSVFEIAQAKQQAGPIPIKDVLTTTYKKIEILSRKNRKVTGISSGFIALDEVTSGFHPGQLIVIAGRPGMGKTSFGLNIIHHVAKVENLPVLIFSFEMTHEQLAMRLISAEAKINGQSLKQGRLKDSEWYDLGLATGVLSSLPIYIDDSPDISILEMRSRARRLKSQTGNLGIVMVDYLQLMKGRRRYESRQLEISDISRSLKFMAKELDCPVLALSQLSRATELHKNSRPQLSDLRESGAIEQDADVVLLLYQPAQYGVKQITYKKKSIPTDGIAEVIIAKQRSGPTGSVVLAFVDSLTQFATLEIDSQEGYYDFTKDKSGESEDVIDALEI